MKYRFNKVIFGATCSQFLLNGVIKVLVEKYKNIDPEFVDKMSRSFYVDNLNTGVQSTETGYLLYKKLKQRFDESHLNLRKWRTKECGEKALGIRWNEVEDTLLIDIKDYVKTVCYDVTKRCVLSVIASFCDPIGYIQPVTVQLKIFFQEICKEYYNWDDKLNDEVKGKWEDIIKNIVKLDEIQIQRCHGFYKIDDPFVLVQLIGFSDVSPLSYGCCVYFKFVSRSEMANVSFISSK